jgi:eukaryotic-like serine/threonine-protein kinase
MTEILVNNRYQLEVEIGRGARGVVYRALDKYLGRTVAVKILSETSIDADSRARLLNEARSAAKLNHPNIVTVYDAGEADGLPYIVMELIDGKTLFEQKPERIEDIISVARQICMALELAHRQGIIHRDLKPENLLVTESGKVKLTDFGLARSQASTRMTVEGSILGTVFYLSPEQALGREVDGRSDLYSVGVLLYELVAGRLPFDGEDPLAIISQHLHASVVPPVTYNNQILPGLNHLIVKLLSKEVEERPASAKEVVLALDSLESDDQKLLISPEVPLIQRIARGRIIGREKQLANAISHWQRAAAGKGQVLAITGEPGIGKTRLARELLTLVEVSGGLTCFTECFPEGDAPYAPIAQMIRNILIHRPGNGNGSNDYSVKVPPLVLADLVTIAPDLKYHFPDVSPNPPLDPAFEQQRLFESVVTLLDEITVKKPLLLIIDDIHWADSGTLALIRYIARRINKQRILLLLIYREVELDEERYFNEVLVDLNRERLIHRIKLTRLNLEQTGEMLEALFQERVTVSFLEDLFNETEGNPFFIEEVCKALIEEGKVYNENGRWHWAALEQFEIPQSVRLAVQSRVRKLPETAQETLRYAAFLGREFEFETLRGISDLDEDSLVDGLEIAVHSQLVDEVHRSGELKFVFAHALIPTSLREGMSYLRRQRLHQKIARYFEKRHPENYVALAYHNSQAGDEGQARKYYLLAGNRALSVYAGPEAERYYRAALELGGDDEQCADAFYGIGRSLRLQSKPADALKIWERAIDLYKSVNNMNRVAWIYALSTRTAWEGGNNKRSLHISKEGLSVVDTGIETREVAALLHEAARACYFNNLYDEAYDLCNKALKMAEKVGDAEVQAEALTTLGILPGQSLQERHAVLSRAVELAETNGLLLTAARAYNNLAVYIGKLQDIRQAKNHFLKAAEIIKPAGMKNHQLFYLMNAAQMTLEIGEHNEVESMIPTLKELSESLEEAHYWGSSLESLEIRLLRIRGDLDQAVDKLTNLRAKNVKKDDKMALSDTNASLADILLELGRYEEAEELINELIELNELKEKIWFGHFFKAILNALQGRVIEARQSYEQATSLVDIDSQGNADIELPFGEAILLGSEGNWEKAFALFEDTSHKRGSQKALWGQAYILRVWAEFHLKRNLPEDIDRAQALLSQALEIYKSLKLPNYVQKLEDQIYKIK